MGISREKRSLWWVVLLAAVTGAAYSRVPSFDFVDYDDHAHIYQNPYLNPPTWEHIRYFWIRPFLTHNAALSGKTNGPYEQLYTPLTFTLWAGLACIARLPQPVYSPNLETLYLSPAPFHCASLLLHIANTILVFVLLRLLLTEHSLTAFTREKSNSDYVSNFAPAIGALLFALHPLQVETIAWITQMNTALSTFFALAALWQYLHWAAGRGKEADTAKSRKRSSRWWVYFSATGCFALALLAKPSAAATPLLAGGLACWKYRLEARALLHSLLPWFLLVVLCVLINRRLPAPLSPKAIAPLWARPTIIGNSWAFYMGKLVWPFPLVSHYQRSTQWVLHQWQSYFVWILPILLCLVIWRIRVGAYVVAGLLIFFAATLPTSGVLPYYAHSISTVADRYVYFAMLGPALIFGWFAGICRRAIHGWDLGRDHKAKHFASLRLVTVVLMLVALGIRTSQQIGHWRNTIALWSSLAEAAPNDWGPYTNLGEAYLRRQEYSRALRCFRTALHLAPDQVLNYSNLGDALVAQGRTREALRYYHQALRRNPGFAQVRLSIANILREQGRLQTAVTEYEAVLRVLPHSISAHYNLALALQAQGKSPAAQRHLEQALSLNPRDAEVHNALALLLAKQGQRSDAMAHWQTAIGLDPFFADARINLGTALAMQGKLNEAITQWHEALRVQPNNPANVQTHFNLGQAFWQQGQTTAAVAQWQTVLRLQPNHLAAIDALRKADPIADAAQKPDKR